ncbi:MAG TPA: hypothetical protein VFA31_01830, partial [Candidatus Polarisedimenticolia bacterium]|nr:hypothetical protein [Candidatus Polarisedimenticolia bacterium]
TRLAAGGAIPLAVVHEAFAEANQRVRREIIVSIPDGAPASLRQLVDHALAAGEPGGFEAVISSGDRNLRLRALAWLHASGSNDHWAYLRAYPPADLVELAAEMDRDLRDRVLAQITSIPIAKLAVLATDLGCYCTMRSRDDFHCAPSDVLARGILAGCAYGYLDAFAGACDELSHELVEPLRDYIETRLAMLDADEPMLDDEEPRYQWTPEDHYQQALQRLR